MDYEERGMLIRRIIAFDDDIGRNIREVSKFGWDCDKELAIMTKSDIQSILEKCKTGKITARQLGDWANFIEGRDDIGFEESRHETMTEIIHRLANPDLGYELNENLIKKIEEALETNAL